MLLRRGRAYRANESVPVFSGKLERSALRVGRRRWEGFLVLGVLVAQSGLGFALRNGAPEAASEQADARMPMQAGDLGEIVDAIWDWLTRPEDAPPPPPPPAEEGGGW